MKRKMKTSWILFLSGMLVLSEGVALANASEAPVTEVRLNPLFSALDSNLHLINNTVTRLSGDRWATVERNGFKVSEDGMRTWREPHPVVADAKVDAMGRGIPHGGRAALAHVGDNQLVLLWRDRREPSALSEYWDRETGNPVPHARRDLWVARSADGGETWSAPEMLFDLPGYFHRHVIVTSEGTIVAPVQYHARDPGRNVIRVFSSDDAGRTWRQSEDLDIGGSGNHDGVLEPTLVELKDGRIWMLMRTNLDEFYETFSGDEGRTWTDPAPSGIAASSSPGYLLRLASGRLVLIWNRLYPEGEDTFPRRATGYLSETAANWHRQELSLALSEDDGRQWSDPIVVARHQKRNGRVSYPSALERSPGEIWIFASHGDLAVSVHEEDLLKSIGGE